MGSWKKNDGRWLLPAKGYDTAHLVRGSLENGQGVFYVMACGLNVEVESAAKVRFGAKLCCDCKHKTEVKHAR
jgi:hypothetical protein